MEILSASTDYQTGIINLFRRGEDNVIYLKQFKGEWISFHKSPIPSSYNRFIRYQKRDRNHYKVSWKNRFEREKACKALGVDSLEGDVNPLRRYLSDEPEITIQRPRRGYYDIESDDRVSFVIATAGGARILCLSIQLEDGTVYPGLLKEDTDEAEKELLDTQIKIIEQNIDQLIGWNSDAFDDLLFYERARMLGCELKIFKRILHFDQMQNFKKHNLNSAESGEEKQSVALNVVAFSLLGEGKKELDGKGTWELFNEDPQRLLEYNLQDVALMPRIEAKTGYIDLQFSVCQLCRLIPNSKSINAMSFIDAFLLRLGSELDHHFPSKFHEEDMVIEKFEGAFVLAPQELGIHRDVHTLDFSALYPSVIKTWNLSTETKLGVGEEFKGATCPGSKMVFSTGKRGIFPIAFERMQEIRKQWSALEKKSEPESKEAKFAAKMSMGAKVVVNSAYGIIGSPFSRYFDKDVAENCTQNGVFLTKSIMAELTRRGLTVLYGDTDSQMFKGCSNDETKDIVKYINTEYIPNLLKECGCKDSYINLEYEKTFNFLVFSTDGKGEGVCKKYIGQYSVFGGKEIVNGPPKIRGLEYRRGDSIKLARDLQFKIFLMLCKQEFLPMPYEKLILETRNLIMNGYLEPDDIVQSKSISRPLSEYKSNSSHIRLAKELEEDGEEIGVGTRVRFYIKNGATSPKEVAFIKDYKNDADRFYLWTRIFEPSLRLLAGAFPRISWAHFRAKRPKPVLAGQLGFVFGG